MLFFFSVGQQRLSSWTEVQLMNFGNIEHHLSCAVTLLVVYALLRIVDA